jgi:peroxiredoxin
MLNKYAPQLVNKLGLTFPVLSDPDSKTMGQLGLLFKLPDEMIEIYQGFGIDLPRFNGEDSWQLPLPGRIIIDQSGTVKDVNLSTDHTDRPEPSDIIDVLAKL